MKNLFILLFSVFSVTVHAQISVGTTPRLSKDSTSKGFVAISKKASNGFVLNTMRLDSMLALAKDSIVFSAGDFAGAGNVGSPVTLNSKVDTLYKNGTADSLVYTIAGRRRAIAFPAGGGGSGTLYGSTGINTDGPMTQAATTTAINNEITSRTNADALLLPKSDSTIANRVTANTASINANSVSIAAKADKNVTFNTQTASYTLVLSDAAIQVNQNVASANNLTVPPNSSVAFAVGTVVTIFQYGAGQTTIVAGAGVTLRSAGGRLKLTEQYSSCSLVKIATNEWTVLGDLTL